MNGQEHISVTHAAALESFSPRAAYLMPDGRSFATITEIAAAWRKDRRAVKKWAKRKGLSFNDPRGGREKVCSLKDLPEDVRVRLTGQQASRRSPRPERAESPLAPLLPFPPTASEVQSLAPPGKYHDLVKKKLLLAYDLKCQRWREQGFTNEPSFISSKSAELGKGFSIWTIKGIARLARSTDDWQEVASAFNRQKPPGQRARQWYNQLDELSKELVHKAVRECNGCWKRGHELFLASGPQGVNTPTEKVWRTALKYVPFREKLRGRDAVKQAAGSIPRHYNDEFAGDAVCLDEWNVDCYAYDPDNLSLVLNYGKNNPLLHVLSWVDERTTFIMGWALVWRESLEEATLSLAERMIRQYGAPLRMVTDRAGRFRALSRRKKVFVSGRGKLVEVLMGPLGELGVTPRGSDEPNPRANRVEGVHRIYAQKARRGDFSFSYRPKKPLRKDSGIDSRVEEHIQQFINHGRGGPRLLSVYEIEKIIGRWVNEINFAETRAKGCNGLTRCAAFNHFQPTDIELARRRPPDQLIDRVFAEKDTRTILPGGVIEFRPKERYSNLELGGWVGEKVTAMRYRREPAILYVFVPDKEGPIAASFDDEVGTNESDVLSGRIARQKHYRKILAREETPLPAQGSDAGEKPLTVNPREFFSRPDAAKETGGLKPLSYFGDDA